MLSQIQEELLQHEWNEIYIETVSELPVYDTYQR